MINVKNDEFLDFSRGRREEIRDEELEKGDEKTKKRRKPDINTELKRVLFTK